MRTTVIFDNLGPYHQARLCAAARVSELTAIQVSARSAEYVWENEGREEGFSLVTLFPQGTSQEASAAGMLRRMQEALEGARPEVVVIPGWSSRAALAALSWCSRRRVPAVVMSESTAWDEKRVGWKEAIKRRLVTLYAAALVGGRPHADYVTQLGLSADRVFAGYDAVDNDYFQRNTEEARKEAASVRARHGLPENYFLASARFIEKKNLPRLLQAYAGYRAACGEESREPWSLVLLGDGALRPSLVAEIDRLHLRDHVLLPGFRQYPDLPAYYAWAGAFIHASTVEPWGLVVNEAMASGLPVLVSDRCGCASDLVESGRNGFTFDPYDVEGLSRLMHRVFSMPLEARLAMGGQSEQIITTWGPRRFAEGLELAARKALASGPLRQATWLDRLLWQGLLRP